MSKKITSFDLLENSETKEPLTIERLKQFTIKEEDKKNNENNCNLYLRPESSFIDLIIWAENCFSKALKDKNNINRIINNNIIIDGQFLAFCEINNINIKTLYKDSILSWKSEDGFEDFSMQGVFLIQSDEVEFIHAALLHKGEVNKDEVGFFILVSENNHLKYIDLRNKFDNWLANRERNNLNIRVIEGVDIPYTKDNKWEDLYLPKTLKSEIKSLVENFLQSKSFYNDNKIPWKRGVIFYGPAGCHTAGTQI